MTDKPKEADRETGEIPEDEPTMDAKLLSALKGGYTEEEERYIRYGDPRQAFYKALWGAKIQIPRIILGDKTMPGKGYKFADGKDYLRICEGVLLEWGLIAELAGVGPSQDVELEGEKWNKKANKVLPFLSWMTTVECIWRVTHAPTGHSETYRIQGRATDEDDRQISQAISSSRKDFYRTLLSIADREDGDPIPVEQAQRSRPIKTGGPGPRKPQGPQSRGQNTQPSSEPQVSPSKDGKDPDLKEMEEDARLKEERKKRAIEEIDAELKKKHWRRYHLEAMSVIRDDLPEGLKEWRVEHWELALQLLQKDPIYVAQSLAKAAEKYPTDDIRKRKLHDLQATFLKGGGKLTLSELQETADAHVSGFSYAVEWWITQLMDRATQQEIDI